MNSLIASLLKDRISEFTYVDKLGGLVRAITYQRAGENITIPVDIGVQDPLACPDEEISDLVPNEGYGCIVYFEDKGMRRVQSRTRGIEFESRMRLVCWVNTAKFNGDNSAGDRIMQQFLGALHVGPHNTGPFIGVRHNVESIPERGKSLFSTYSYPDSARQYLMWPFDAFAIDVVTAFRIKPGCEDEVAQGDEACWTPPANRRRRNPSEFSCDELNAPVTGLTDSQKGCIEGCGGGGTCDLCTEIAKDSSTAQAIVDCIDDAGKTEAVQELICDPCPPCDPTTVNGEESDTPTITVLQGGVQVGTLDPATGVHTVPACVPCENVTVQLRDSANNDLGSPDIYSAGTNTTKTAPDGSFQRKDSAGVDIGSPVPVRSGQSLVLATCPDGSVLVNGGAFGAVKSNGSIDIPVKNGLGVSVGSKVGPDFIVPTRPADGDPIIYAQIRTLWSGQVTSYRAGDEGSMLADGFFDRDQPVGPNSLIQHLTAWNTLAHPNIHGNTLRFTNRSGGAAASSGNRWVQDHYYGTEHYILGTYGSGANWNAAIDAGVAINATLGETGMYLIPVKCVQSIQNMGSATPLTGSPWSAPATVASMWCSSTASYNTANAHSFIGNSTLTGALVKTQTVNVNYGIYIKRLV